MSDDLSETVECAEPAEVAEIPEETPVKSSLPITRPLAEGNELPPDSASASPPQKSFLHIGCGTAGPERLPAVFRGEAWREIRLDIDPAVRPDIVASSADMSTVADASVDAVWSSHNLEHLEAHEAPLALQEMYRVLKADGFALITLPDLQAVAQLVAMGRLCETVYQSPMGPITALDMLYGHRKSLAAGNRFMAHRNGFDAKSLGESLLAAGFKEVRVRAGTCYDLWAYALKTVL
ncbi:MAG: class I SAM-dependent methyltransferase [Candidatus Competibacteraceae bacterium]|nr:class I SAM-dependent methyltransferase [Candidatus Competibacteraceae bacterium]MCP5126595.1 class I SAM-dependent methyltransferase [Gammaproteobacteria bacterium]